jgi:hypothetical protein
MTMDSLDRADNLHRLVKQTLDSGAAASLAEAEAMFQGYRLNFAIGPAEAHDPLHQAALLTGIALARRVFLGGVSVVAPVDAPLAVPMPFGRTLGQAVAALGASLTLSVESGPLVMIGGTPQPRADRFQIRTVYAGWRGGIVPAHADIHPEGGGAMPLAAMLSAALAVNEAFFHVSGEMGAAGRRTVGLSLWNPAPTCDWLSPGGDEPTLRYLPSQLWLIGLGHLGQAYLWGLGLLPFPDPSGLSLVLQDVDRLTRSSESTSILTDQGLIGQKKTRAMAAWAERRGFATSIHERLFDTSFRRQDSEPPVALSGVDNAVARRALDQVGFQFVVEAGLGRDYRDFRSMRLHALPGSRACADLWKAEDDRNDLTGRPAYQKMLREGELDQCGITLLAGKAVGAPFVGAVAACLVLSEVLRLLHGGPLHQVIELDLQSTEHRSAVVNDRGFGDLNPGYVAARD